MLQIEIDGKEISVEQGSTIIEAAKIADIFIPHFCYHKKLSIAANCRMCLVDVEKVPKPIPACATPVTDGMVVSTTSPLAKTAQQGVMEFLLINHPLDCPICDEAGECQLQDLAMGYGKDTSRFIEDKRAVAYKSMGPLVSAEEMSRCIYCTRCIRFTEEVAGYQEFGMINRGEHSEIIAFSNSGIQSEISGNVIDLCPVGALTSKPFRYSARSWELSRRKSISAHDSLGSNLIVQVKDRRVKRVLPLENNTINECWLADRDRFAYLGLNHPQRLLTPRIKQDGKWHDVDWQTAFAYVVKGLNGVANDHGKDAIGMWLNANNTVEELYLSKKLAKGFAINSIDSELFIQDKRLNPYKKGALWLGQSIEKFAESDAFLFIGTNLRIEQPLLTTRVRKAANAGAKVSTLHYRQEQLYMPTSVRLQAHPTQWLAQLRALIFNCQYGSNKFEINKLVEELKSAQRPTIILGAEAQNHPQFAEIYAQALRLAKATGATLGVFPHSANTVASDVLQLDATAEHYDFNAMLTAPRKAVMLVNVEPNIDVFDAQVALASLQQAETVIAFTAYNSAVYEQYADVMLPIVPYTETSGSFINLEGRLQSFYGVVQSLGEARPLWKVLRVLANLLNIEGFDYNTSQEILKEALPSTDLQAFLNNDADIDLISPKNEEEKSLIRVGGVALYQSDAILRRSDVLQQTVHAQIPQVKVNSKTLADLAVVDGEFVVASHGHEELTVKILLDNTLADDVVYLPLHQDNAYLGGLMNTINIRRG